MESDTTKHRDSHTTLESEHLYSYYDETDPQLQLHV